MHSQAAPQSWVVGALVHKVVEGEAVVMVHHGFGDG